MRIVWSKWLVPGGFLLAVISSPISAQNTGASEEAIAGSHALSSPKGAKLSHPEEWRFLGQLVGRRFYRVWNRNIVTTDFVVVDNNTIAWKNMSDSLDAIRRVGLNKFVFMYFSSGKFNKIDGDIITITDNKLEFAPALGRSGSITFYFINKDGNLVYSGANAEDDVFYASLDPVGGGPLSALVNWHPDSKRDLARIQADIQKKCPSDISNLDANLVSNINCLSALEVERDMRAKMGENVSDALITKLDERAAAKRIAQQSAQAEQNQAFMSQALQQYASGAAAIAAARSAAHAAASPPQLTSGYSSQRSAQTTQQATPFGALPTGVGTAQQRQFWADKCASRPNDGSSAAQGCQQTQQMLHVVPASNSASSASLPTGGLTHNGGYASQSPSPPAYGGVSSNGSSSAGSKSGLVASQCLVSIPGRPQHFHNACGFTVAYEYCVMTPGLIGTCKAGSSPGYGADSVRAFQDTLLSVDPGGNYLGPLSYRIAACRGALGEVLPKLLQANPPKVTCN